LKKINILERDNLGPIKKEIDFWKKINNHPNIVKMIEYEINDSNVFILMEFCSEGTLLDLINNRQEKIINEGQALYIIQQIANGINHMHCQTPPIAHRDIKIENVLKVGNNFKLCDFGSASSDTLDPKKETKNSILENFSKFEKNTTFMYRPPEMCDPYSKFPIFEKVDVWMLGCILYTLLFKQHPFQDAQKLTIINANYYIPVEAKSYSEKILDFLRLMLTTNPANRPSAKDVINIMLNWENIRVIELPEETQEIKNKQLRNVKSNKNELLSADDLYKAQQAILREQAKRNKFLKRNGRIVLFFIFR
jgi:AP2-associated kinase